MDRFDEAVTAPDALAKFSIAEMIVVDSATHPKCADCIAHETGECDYHFESFGRYWSDDDTESAADEQFAAILAWGK